jgi:drug/metabolite transporter (DMT)-like permease
VFALGLIAALLASALFNLGVALQAIEARKAPRELGLRVSLLQRLLRRPIWLAGLALGLLGIAPQVLAYALAPFVVVQTSLVAGLFLLLLLSVRVLHERVGLFDVVGVTGIVAGVALVSWGAPAHSEAHRQGMAVVAVAAGLALAALAPLALRGRRADTAMASIVAAGCGFGATNIATKLLSDDLGLGNYANAGAWAIYGVGMAVVATLTNMSAFQRSPAATVVPVSTAVQTFLPVVLAPLFLREAWSSSAVDGTPILAGIAVAIVGTLLVAHGDAVSDLAAGGVSS